MPPTTVTIPAFGSNQKVPVTDIKWYDFNGLLDATSDLQVASDTPSIATVAFDPLDKRAIWITGVGGGSTTIRVIQPIGQPTSPGPLHYQVTISAPVNQSHVEPGVVGPPQPK